MSATPSSSQDTPPRVVAASLPRGAAEGCGPAWCILPGAAPAVAADRVVETWSRCLEEELPHPAVPAVLVGEQAHAALIQHVRARFLRLEPRPLQPAGWERDELDRLQRTTLDAGATLIAGGCLREDSPEVPAWLPSLLVNVEHDSPLFRHPDAGAARPYPMLAVLRCTEDELTQAAGSTDPRATSR